MTGLIPEINQAVIARIPQSTAQRFSKKRGN
jgi:hypothetical protein